MKSLDPITVLLAEDHMIVRQGLKNLLETEKDFEIVGEATTGRQAVEMVATLRPAVVVMDIAMPLLNGLEAARQIRLLAPDTKILILSAHSDDAYVERALELGVAGFLIKQSSVHVLKDAIRGAHKGKAFYSPEIVRHLRARDSESKSRKAGKVGKGPELTPREAEVLQLVAEGKANKQVAAELGISIKTVEKHRDHLMRKLDIHDTAGLTRYAISAGIIESSVQVTIV
jgi:DNA-binding NarL/FixJ family response regulator